MLRISIQQAHHMCRYLYVQFVHDESWMCTGLVPMNINFLIFDEHFSVHFCLLFYAYAEWFMHCLFGIKSIRRIHFDSELIGAMMIYQKYIICTSSVHMIDIIDFNTFCDWFTCAGCQYGLRAVVSVSKFKNDLLEFNLLQSTNGS